MPGVATQADDEELAAAVAGTMRFILETNEEARASVVDHGIKPAIKRGKALGDYTAWLKWDGSSENAGAVEPFAPALLAMRELFEKSWRDTPEVRHQPDSVKFRVFRLIFGQAHFHGGNSS